MLPDVDRSVDTARKSACATKRHKRYKVLIDYDIATHYSVGRRNGTMRRRSFFGAAFAGIGGIASAKPPKPPAGEIPTRVLGRTGQKLSIVGLGGARFQMIPFDEGVKLVQHAYDLGINYFDMARDYGGGHNEEVYGAAVQPFRKNIFMTTKCGKRTRKEAEADLDTSLRTMKTDYLDLWQMHMVNSKEIIEQAMGPGGTPWRPLSPRRRPARRTAHRLHGSRRPSRDRANAASRR